MSVIVIFFLRVREIVGCRRSCSRCHSFQHSAPRRVHQKLLPPLPEDSTGCAYGWSAAHCRLLVPITSATTFYDLNAIPRSAPPLQSLCPIAVFGHFCRARLQAGTVDSSTSSPEGEPYRGRRTSWHTDSSGQLSHAGCRRHGSGERSRIRDTGRSKNPFRSATSSKLRTKARMSQYGHRALRSRTRVPLSFNSWSMEGCRRPPVTRLISLRSAVLTACGFISSASR